MLTCQASASPSRKPITRPDTRGPQQKMRRSSKHASLSCLARAGPPSREAGQRGRRHLSLPPYVFVLLLRCPISSSLSGLARRGGGRARGPRRGVVCVYDCDKGQSVCININNEGAVKRNSAPVRSDALDYKSAPSRVAVPRDRGRCWSSAIAILLILQKHILRIAWPQQPSKGNEIAQEI